MLTLKRLVAAFTVASAVTVACLVASSLAYSGFTASVKNTNNAIGTGTSFLTVNRDNSYDECSSVPSGSTIPATASFSCSPEQFPSTPVTANGKSTIKLTQSGTIPFTSATYQAGQSCAPVKLDNNSVSSNVFLNRGGISYNQPAPTGLAGINTIKLNGINGYVANVSSAAGLQNFSLGIWFKTTDTTAGPLFSWSTAVTDQYTGHYDRGLYLTSAGKLAFSTYGGNAARTVTSTTNYNDSAWHYAVVTGQSNVTSSTSRLIMYVDGAQQANTTFNTATVAETTSTGYWHVGQAVMTTSDGYSGSGNYFKGNISNFTAEDSVWTLAQVQNLYNAGTYTTFASRMSTLAPENWWILGDTGRTTFTGPYPVIGTQNPCDHILVTVGTSDGKCLFPVSSSPCATITSGDTGTNTLTALANAPAVALAPSTSTVTITITNNLVRANNFSPFDSGLRLLIPLTITETGFQTTTFVWGSNVTVPT